MSRPRQKLDESKQGRLVLDRLKKEPPGWKRERLLAVKLGLEGEQSLDEIAIAVGHARSTIQKWFDLYRKSGIEGLLSLHRGKGPQSRLSQEAADALQAGLKAGKWREAGAIMKFLAKEHRIHVSRSAVYHYLGKCGARLRVARPCQLKKDPAAAEAFKSELAGRLEALELEPGRRVRLWVMDEMRCGLHTETRRVWGLPGVRPMVPVQQKYEWQYVYGALEVGKAGAQFLYAESVGLEWNSAFLGQIAAHDPDAVHVVIYDGAGFHHRDGDPALPANVRIVNLPAYSPELNPVEKLWDIVRDAICNRVFSSLQQLQEAITAVLSRYWQDAKAVFNLIGRGWLLAQANVIGPDVIPI
jgi:transposase